MHSINTYKDMEPFAGCVVAYQTESPSFSDSFSFDDEPKVKFGTVSNMTSRFQGVGSAEDRTGFMLYEFLKPASAITHHGMTKTELEQHSLTMRAAFPSEIDKLRNAIDLGKATHCHASRWGLDWEKLKNLAEQHFDKLILDAF